MSQHREHVDDGPSHLLVLTTLREAARALTVKQVADAVALSIATTRFHLDRLEQSGLISSAPEQRTHRPGRPRVLYTARPAEAVEAGAAYRQLADVLARQLIAVAGTGGALQAGRQWAERLTERSRPADPVAGSDGGGAATIDRIIRLLDDSGFAPIISATGRRIELHSCPFMSLARERADAVCTVHLGLIQGLLDERGHAVRVVPVLDGSGPCIVELPADIPHRKPCS